MINKPLINRSGSTKSRNNFLIFRLTVAGTLVGIFALFGFLDKNTLAQTWSEPVNSPPQGQVAGPVWAQNSSAQTGGLYLNGKARFDTTGSADAFCTSAKVCAVDNAAAYGLTGESGSGYGLYATSGSGVAVYGASTSGYAGYFNGGNVVLAAGKIGVDNISPSALLTLGTAATTAGTLSLAGATTGVVTMDVLPAAGTWTFTLPPNGGTAGQYLQTDGAGNATWQTVAAGSQTPWTSNINAGGYTLTNLGTNITAAAGLTIASTGAALALNSGSGALTSNATTVTLGGGATMYGGAAASGNLTLDSTSNGTKGYTIIDPTGGNVGIGNNAPAATLSLGTAGTRAGSLYLAGATTNGVTVNVPASVTTAYALTLPPAAPTVNGQALTATTAGVASWTTISAGSQTPWTAAENAASYSLTGLGTNLTAAAGLTIASTGAALAINPGSGALTSTATTVTLGGGATMYGGAAASGNLTLDSTSNGTKGYTIIDPTGGNVGIGNSAPAATLALGTASTRTGTMSFASASNAFTVTVSPSATTSASYTLTLPTTAGTNGQYLQTNGSGTTTWATVAGGGTVTSSGSAANYLAKFSTATNITDSIIYDTGTYVGVGTASPGETLQANGAIKSTGVVATNTPSSTVLSYQSSAPAGGVVGSFIGSWGPNTSTLGAINFYLAHSDGSAGTTSLVINNQGNVGIGTGAPTYKLHVAGTLYASGQVYSNGVTVCQSNGTNCPSGGSMGGSGNSNYIPKFTGSTTLGNSLIYDNGSAVGINTVSPTDGVLDVVTYAGNNAIYGASSANGTGVYGVGGTYGVYGTGSQYGVWGTGSAGGVAGISNNNSSYGVYASNTAGGWAFYTSNNSYVGGNLSAGSISATGTIFTSGSVSANTGVSSSATITSTPAIKSFYASNGSPSAGASLEGNWSTSDYWGIGPNNGGSDRTVRIGSTNYDGTWNANTITLNVVGGVVGATSLVAVGNVFGQNFIPTSDIRLKENIKPLDENYGLSVINRLNPVSFYWKDKSNWANKDYGFIAQDVQEVLPDLVIKKKDGMFGLNYDGLIAPIVKSIQEQQKEIDDQKQQQDIKNQALEATNKEQQKEIDDLKQQIEELKAK